MVISYLKVNEIVKNLRKNLPLKMLLTSSMASISIIKSSTITRYTIADIKYVFGAS